MNKIIRVSVPCIIAFLFLLTLFWLVRASSQALASGDAITKSWDRKQFNKGMDKQQNNLIVNTLQDELNNDGDCSLREAIEAANTNKEVDACGTGEVLTDTISFGVAGTITVTSQFSVTAGGSIEIFGSNSITISGDNSVPILFIDIGADLSLDSLRIVDGFGSNYGGVYNLGKLVINNNTLTGNRSDYVGGSLYNGKSGVLTIISSSISNSNAIAGGGIYNWGEMTITYTMISSNTGESGRGGILNIGKLNIINSTISGNVGGGIDNTGTLTITNSTLSGNHAAYAGGILNGRTIFGGCLLTIINSTFNDNSAVYDGGAIQNYGVLEIINSILYSNTSGLNGGGIYNHFYGTLDITNSAFIENSSNSTGGGITSGGALTITHSIFTGNSTVWYGGGISTGGTMTLANSTLSDNSAVHYGGGIDNGGMLSITYSTLSGSSAMRGGGIYNAPGYGETMLNSSIVAYSPTGGNCAGSPITDRGYNIEDIDTCGFDPANGSMPHTDPLLGPLHDNGGPTWTYALSWNSPAIDAGDDTKCPPADQRGISRPLDGDNDDVARCDIGSYEREYQAVSPTEVLFLNPGYHYAYQWIYFTASVEPISTSLPLTYTWKFGGDLPFYFHSSMNLRDTVRYIWGWGGTYTITVTASNLAGSVMDSHQITIIVPSNEFYLPVVIKSGGRY